MKASLTSKKRLSVKRFCQAIGRPKNLTQDNIASKKTVSALPLH
jgi:hypothetical protein